MRTKPEEARVPSGYGDGLGSYELPRTTGGMSLSSAGPKSSGKSRCHRMTSGRPLVVEVEGLAALHHGKCVKQEFGHAGAEGLHLGQRPLAALNQPVVVRAETSVVLQPRQGGHVDDAA